MIASRAAAKQANEYQRTADKVEALEETVQALLASQLDLHTKIDKLLASQPKGRSDAKPGP